MIERKTEIIDIEKYQKYSVIIPLIKGENGYEILFEVRAEGLKKQPGEVCFPGGRAEPMETAWETAAREACEELLIQKEQMTEQMPLDIFLSPFDIVISPFAVILDGYSGTKNPDEVDSVFTVPLIFFKEHEPERYECDILNVPGGNFPFEKIPGGKSYPWRRGRYEVNFYEYDGHVIWGLTAKIMKASVGLIGQFIKQWEDMENEKEKK